MNLMRLQFIGVGAAFAFDNFQSNMVLEVDGKRLLIDAGGDARHALRAQNLSHRSLDAVYVSHLHGDHVHGMEWLALATYFDPEFKHGDGNKKKLQLFLSNKLKRDIWEHSMRAGCATLQGVRNTLETYFDVKGVGRNGKFEFAGTSFRLVQTVHYVDDREIVPSYGLFWTAPNGQVVFLTTDTQFAPASIKTFINKADVVFHDCEVARFPSGIHAHYSELKTLPAEMKRKMWLYHYQDGEKPDCTADGFAGWVTQGQVFDFSAK
ncbi:MAG TPA: MBL fold metallo-hydrolase [Planktothrix sp.]|jgi:ribonuclease BN (tRNA processing enzyme)